MQVEASSSSVDSSPSGIHPQESGEERKGASERVSEEAWIEAWSMSRALPRSHLHPSPPSSPSLAPSEETRRYSISPYYMKACSFCHWRVRGSAPDSLAEAGENDTSERPRAIASHSEASALGKPVDGHLGRCSWA